MFVADELENLLDTKLTLGRIHLGLLNRIVIEDLMLDDRSGKEMLKVTRFSAKFDILPLFQGRISINNIQLFGFTANLEKATPQSDPNFQFIVDTFASKDTVPKQTNLNLRINSLLLRRGRVSYNVLSEKETPGKFNVNHINLRNIIASISLKALQNDSINASIKRMSLEEHSSGFKLDKLGLKITGNEQKMQIAGFCIEMPHTNLRMDTIHMEYDSLKAMEDFVHNVRFSCRMLPSDITLRDLSAFVPAFSSFKDSLQIEAEVNGTIDQLNCPRLMISSGKQFLLRGDVSFQDLSHFQDAYVFGNLSHLHANPDGVAFFIKNFSKNYKGVPPMLQRLGTISFQGEISGYFTDLVTYGRLRTNIGSLSTDIKFSSDKEKESISYSGSMATSDFELGKLTDNPKWGKITFNMGVQGRHTSHSYPSIEAKGLISSFDYSGYTYENITLDGEYKQGGFTGSIVLDDENASLNLNGTINIASKIPTFNFLAEAKHVRPHTLNLTPKYKDAEFSVKLKADFTGGSIDEMNGEINIDSLQFISPEQSYLMDNFKLTATQQAESKRLDIHSAFLRGSIVGDYSYHTLPTSFLNILHKYIPALLPLNTQTTINTENNFGFDLHIYNTELFSKVFGLPLTVYTHSTLKGYFNDKAQRMRVEGYFPHLRYNNKFIESGLILCENPSDHFHARIRFTHRKAESSVNLAIEALAKNDSIQTILNWGNSSKITYSGQLSSTARFMRQQLETQAQLPRRQAKRNHSPKQSPLKMVVDIHPTDIILNDTLWNIHPAQVVLDSGKVYVHNFNFTNQKRFLRINGVLSDQPEDTVHLDLQQINIGYVFDIADLGVNFQGEATGPAYATGIFKKPVMSTDLFIRNLGINNGLLGDANIHGEWHHDS